MAKAMNIKTTMITVFAALLGGVLIHLEGATVRDGLISFVIIALSTTLALIVGKKL